MPPTAQRERRDHTLEPNALVNELCLRFFGNQPLSYQNRAHFFAIAAQTMRRILIDHARARIADKRGGEQQRVPLSDRRRLERSSRQRGSAGCGRGPLGARVVDPRAARVVELRFFGGLTEEDVAEVLSVSVITVKRDWKAARAWLIGRLQSLEGRAPPH